MNSQKFYQPLLSDDGIEHSELFPIHRNVNSSDNALNFSDASDIIYKNKTSNKIKKMIYAFRKKKEEEIKDKEINEYITFKPNYIKYKYIYYPFFNKNNTK